MVELLSIRVLTFLYELLANFSDLSVVVEDSSESVSVLALRVSLDVGYLEPDPDVISNEFAFFFRLVKEVLGLVVDTFVMGTGELYPSSLTFSHGPHDYLVVIMIPDIPHFKFLYCFAFLCEVNKLSIAESSLMAVVDIIICSNVRSFPFFNHILYDATIFSHNFFSEWFDTLKVKELIQRPLRFSRDEVLPLAFFP